MLDFNMYDSIKRLHLEITNRCQASCPMCARNYHGGLPNPLIQEISIDINFFKEKLPVDFIKNLEYLEFCSNFGDCILHKDLIDIIRYFVLINPSIYISIYTNGSARTVEWWKNLAAVLPNNHSVNFAIDGLEHTHKLYRIGTDFNKIIENARAFIQAGGIANWHFISFEHNYHEIDSAKKLSNELGFKTFYEKESSRFIGKPSFDVYDPSGNVVHVLRQPKSKEIKFIKKEDIDNFRSLISVAKIDCQAIKESKIYIDAHGNIWPCSWIGAVPYMYDKEKDISHEFLTESKLRLTNFLSGLNNNLFKDTFDNIIHNMFINNNWDDMFNTDPLPTCARICGHWENINIPQARKEIL